MVSEKKHSAEGVIWFAFCLVQNVSKEKKSRNTEGRKGAMTSSPIYSIIMFAWGVDNLAIWQLCSFGRFGMGGLCLEWIVLLLAGNIVLISIIYSWSTV